MPLTFQVATFTASVRAVRMAVQRARPVRADLAPALPDARVDHFVDPAAERAIDAPAEQAVEAEGHLAERVVHFGETVRSVDIDLGAQPQAGRFGLVLHPAQRNPRQAIGRALGVAAADVRMRADEPALLDHFGLGRLAL